MLSEWVEQNCRRSADKTNIACHPDKGPHHMYYKTADNCELFDSFKRATPEFRYSKTVFLRLLRQLYWLKAPKSSDCLCQACTNTRLFMTAVIKQQKDLGIQDMLTDNRYNLVRESSCPPPSPAPIGQHDLLHSDCATNDCDACRDCEPYFTRIARPLLHIGEGLKPEVYQWKKVERVDDNGRVIKPTVKKLIKYPSMNKFLDDFRSCVVNFREHYHEWQFQMNSENVRRHALLEGKDPQVFHYYFDLSENYSLKHQWAPQSTHWASQSATLATGVGFYDPGNGAIEKIELFVFSLGSNHDTSMTARCQQVMEEYIIQKFSNIKGFRIHVDNAPTHYRTNAYLSACGDRVMEDQRRRSLVFWGKYHGKTVGDSAGGSLKRWLDRNSKLKNLIKLEDLVKQVNERYVPSKEAKTTMRRAFVVSKRAATNILITNRRVRDLKSYFEHNYSYDPVDGRLMSNRRHLSCVCSKCHAGIHDECENQGVGGLHAMY